MPNPTPSVTSYLRELLAHGTSVFSVLVFVLALLSLLIPVDLAGRLASSGLLVLLSLLIAGFNTWKAAVKRIPGAAELDIVVKAVEIGSQSYQNNIPNSPIEFRISLDAINHGQESATLTAFEITDFKLGSPLLGDSPIGCSIEIDGRRLDLPFQFKGGQRATSLRSVIQVQLLERDPEKFAALLGQLQGFRIDLTYTYEDMQRSRHKKMLPIRDTFAQYKNRQIESWKKAKRFDLVVKSTEAPTSHA